MVEIHKATTLNVNDVHSIASGNPQHRPVDIPEIAFSASVHTQQFPCIIPYGQGEFVSVGPSALARDWPVAWGIAGDRTTRADQRHGNA